ncbi:MAG: CDP-glucose 4,6-dehydratase [Rhodoblastus sp.]
MEQRSREMEALVISSAFWRNRRVFVTGHTGFKGAWLTAMLERLNAQATGYGLAPPTEPSLFALNDMQALIDDRRGDIADVELLAASMAQSAPEIVLHMAAQPLVSRGYRDPVETYRTNVMGAVALLEAVRRTPSVRVVVVVTTDKCYENKEWAWGYREVDRLGGRDPYSNSKACAELVTQAYAASFLGETGVRVVSARAGNVIGGGDFADNRILPDAVRARLAGEKLRVRSPSAVRPWQHVLEPLYGYLLLAERTYERDDLSDAFNFGPGLAGERNVAQLLDGFYRGFGADKGWELDAIQHPHEASLLRLDISRAMSELGWAPLMNFEETLAWTARWYRAFIEGDDARALTFDQVDAYLGQRVRLSSPFSPPQTDAPPRPAEEPHVRKIAV